MSGTRALKKRLAVLLASMMIVVNMPIYGTTTNVEANDPVPTRVEVKWSRSSEAEGYKPPNQLERTWSWETASGIDTPITDADSIWDANTDKKYYSGYMGNVKYPGATWALKGKYHPYADLRRFRGEFEIPIGYTTKDFVRLKSVRQDEYKNIKDGNIIPINDNVYIYVYPEEFATKLTDTKSSEHYFMNYLAFWTGTANQTSNGIKLFGDVSGTPAYRDANMKLLKLTDGWYAEAKLDNIGKTMYETAGEKGAGTKFIIDIFTEDNTGGGGIDEMILEFLHNPAQEVQAEDENYVMLQDKPISVMADKGILKNDIPKDIVEAELLTGLADGFDVKKNTNNNTHSIYKGQQKVADITRFDEQGQFVLDPVDGYIGEIKFKYRVYDKLGNDYDNPKIAITTCYVLPKLSIEHIDKDTNELIYKSETPVYGNPYEIEGDTIYLDNTGQLDAIYEVSEAPGVKEKNEYYQFVDGKMIDSNINIANLPYEHTFGMKNETIQLFYEAKYPYIINYFIDGTTTPVPGIDTSIPIPIKGSAKEGELIPIEHLKSSEGYKVKADQPEILEVKSDVDANKADVYYEIKSDLEVTLKYVERGNRDKVLAEDVILTGTFAESYQNQIPLEVIDGYTYVSTDDPNGGVFKDQDEVKVVYVEYMKQDYNYQVVHQYVEGGVVVDEIIKNSRVEFNEAINQSPLMLDDIKTGYHYTTTSVIGIKDYEISESGAVTGTVPANQENSPIIITFTYETNPYNLNVLHTYYDIDDSENIALRTTSSAIVVYNQEIVEGPQPQVEGYTYTDLIVNGVKQNMAKVYQDTIKGDLTLEFVYKEVEANLLVEHKYSQDEDKNFEVSIAVRGGDRTTADEYDDTSASGAYPVDEKYYVSKINLTTQRTTDSAIQTTGSAIQTTGPAIQTTSSAIGLNDRIDIDYGMSYKITIEYDVKEEEIKPEPKPEPEPEPEPESNPQPKLEAPEEIAEFDILDGEIPAGGAHVSKEEIAEFDILDGEIPAGGTRISEEEIPAGGVDIEANPKTGDSGLDKEMKLLLVSGLVLAGVLAKKKRLKVK